MNLQALILKQLLNDDTYLRKVLPFIKKEYFDSNYIKAFDEIVSFVQKYNKIPTLTALKVEINESGKEIPSALMEEIDNDQQIDHEWLVDKTEKWCQDRAIDLAIMESMLIIDGKHKTHTKSALPDILTKALSVSFDSHVGHDYIDDAHKRYQSYHETVDRIPFDLSYFNKITKGGLPPKTLTIVLASTGVGKSLFMCHHAANVLMQGKNVLYITMEMAEERIAERIDANLMNTPVDMLPQMAKKTFDSKIEKLLQNLLGNLSLKNILQEQHMLVISEHYLKNSK